MGIFSGRSDNRRIRDLEERCETLERAIKNIRAEWDDTYDKVRVSMARIVKRAAVVEASEEPRAPRQAPLEIPRNDGRMLSPHQREMQDEILRRRAGL